MRAGLFSPGKEGLLTEGGSRTGSSRQQTSRCSATRVCAGELVRSYTNTENSCFIGHKTWLKHHRFKFILVLILSVTDEDLFWISLITNEVQTLKMYSWNYILSHLEFLVSIINF